VAPRPAPIGRPVGGGSRPARRGLAALAAPPGHEAAEPLRLLLPGLPVGGGQRSQGRPEGGAGAGGGAAQHLPGHGGAGADRAAHGGVAVGEHRAADHRR